MFKSEVYIKRREELHKKMKSGLALFIGNVEAPLNYPANTYHFRQDSDFLYFFGLDLPGFAGLDGFRFGKGLVFSAMISTWTILSGWVLSQRLKNLPLNAELLRAAPDVET